MRHAIATLLYRTADRLTHVDRVHTEVVDHDGVRTVTVTDHHNRIRATYDPDCA